MPDKQLRDWFKGFLGRRYAAVERVLIERALEKGHGYQIFATRARYSMLSRKSNSSVSSDCTGKHRPIPM